MRRRRAFTLIELAVVIAIIGVLIALLIPAMNAARYAARRAQCINNMKQIGLATLSYQTTQNVFPMSATAGEGRGINHSCFAMILPELEQQPLFSAYNFRVENYDAANRTSVGTRLSLLLCPESPLSTDPLASEGVRAVDGSRYPAGSAFARNHYGANWGGSRTPLGDDFTREKRSYRGVMMRVRVETTRGPTRCVRPQDVRDGLSNTLLFGEKRDGQGWAVGGYAGSEFDAAPSPLPPDSPETRTIPTGSFHPGLTHFVFGDGSARALRASIARAIWYGLLTRDGRELIPTDTF